MSDYKSVYSEAAQYYITNEVEASSIDRARYERSKLREKKYNELWRRNSVNLNDVCDEFAPGDLGYKEGVKFIFEGDRYKVKADMASGYLRILDKDTGRYVKLDGAPGGLDETHFKIYRREEM